MAKKEVKKQSGIGIILGIGIAITVFLFFILAMSLVFERPDYSECNVLDRDFYTPYRDLSNISDEEIELRNQQQLERDQCYEKVSNLRSDVEGRIFISSIVIGLVLVVSILFMLSMPNIAGGIGASGIALIVYGFSVGWRNSGDMVKLFALFITAAIIICIAVIINLRYNKK